MLRHVYTCILSFRVDVCTTPPNKQRSSTEAGKFRLGQKIEGRFRGKGRWYKGRVIGVNPGGTYDLRYEDGDEDLGLDASAIKSADSAGAGGARNPFPTSESSAVSARSGGQRERGAGGGSSSPRIGDRVEARVPGTTRWQQATVVGENRDGTLDVRFRDNTEERNLDPRSVRALEGSEGEEGRRRGRAPAESFRVGDDVEARYRGKSTWFKGVIRRVNDDNSYDIRYADGDQETGVDSSLVRSLGGRPSSGGRGRDGGGGGGGLSDVEASSPATGRSYRAGEKVEARFGGRARWFKATVQRPNRDGTFHLLYDDGDEERAVDKALMRRIDDRGGATRSGSRSPGRRVISGASSEEDLLANPSFRQGDKVEARYKRGRQWYVGTIRAVGRDGTYDIRYEDGDIEDGVDPGLVRKIGAGSADSLGSAAGAKRGGSGDFLEGEKVEARFGGRSRWYKATVQRRNRDGSYHLLYVDGDEERAVEKHMIRKFDEPEQGYAKTTSPRSSSAAAAGRDSRKPRVGDEIEARYKRGHKWYPGVIRAVNRDGTYDIRYKDGDTERDVDPSLVRGEGGTSIDTLASSEEAAKEAGYSRGDKIEARFRGRSSWFKATVERDNRDGTYHLLYEDGDEERAVGTDLMRRVRGREGLANAAANARAMLGGRSPNRRQSNDADFDSVSKKHRVGDDIEARYKRGRKWFPGTIQAANRNGTYDIRYKDGDAENGVEAALIRQSGRGGSPADPFAEGAEGEEFAEGDRVEARFGGRSRWFKATVERKNRDGTYFLVYADGDEERAVEKSHIRKLGGGKDGHNRAESPTRRVDSSSIGRASEGDADRRGTIRVGDDVEARYKKGRKWYPGVVRAVNRSGTYDIRYKDGDSEYDVDPTFVRHSSDEPPTANADSKRRGGDFLEDENVEARFGGRSRWFKAKVERVNRDGTYHLLYADGDEERSVPKDLMRKLGNDNVAEENKGVNMTGGGYNGQKKHRVGDEIDARYKKGRKWYPGTIKAVNRDGTFDIRYADGDTERDVDPSMVRGKEAASDDSQEPVTNDNFLEGDKVEARFGGRSRWFKATVARRHRNGTYSLRYEDGDEETSVEKHLIRRVGTDKTSASESKSPGRRVVSGADSDVDSSIVKKLRVGDDVEARYKKGRKWFPGIIHAANRNGTYDIRYKDGDSERDVEPELVRGLSDDRGGGGDFKVGDKVEGRFGGRARWHKATIERVNRNGTYDLLYVDGDEERNVEKGLVRGIGGVGGGRRSGGSSPDRRELSGARMHDSAEPGGGSRAELREGDEIEAKYKRGRMWYPGSIRTVNRDGTYDVRYKDGDSERSVDRGLIRRAGENGVDPTASRVDATTAGSFLAGDEVEARFGGRSRWFPAKVKRKNRDGTYYLLYADGDEERSVENDMMRRVNRKDDYDNRLPHGREESRPGRQRAGSTEALGSSAPGRYQIGDKVEARFGGRSRWFKATVQRENSDGTYSLLYANGDRERAVDTDLIRSIGGNDESKGGEMSTSEAHRVGDEIEARYKRGRKWYPGVVRAVNIDGTYDIRYKDGDSERGVEAALVRHSSGAAGRDNFRNPETQAAASDFNVGDKVEARFGGGGRWFKATVKQTNRDGTLDLFYADGDKERGVESYLVRKKDDSGSGPESVRRSSARRAVPGVDSETDVDSGEAKLSDRKGRGASQRRDPPRAGEAVEARSRGGSRWMPGNVSRVHRDGSYDIDFDNGDIERDIPANHVRHTAGDGERGRHDRDADRDRGLGDVTSRQRKFTALAGDRVEARFHGRSAWRRGEVTKVHSDGTYDIIYADDERERRVNPDLVRLPHNAASRDYASAGRHGIIASSSSDTEGSQKAEGRGRSKERRDALLQEPAGEDAELAATRIRRALRKSGKTVDDLTRKLERARKMGDGRDRRGHRKVGGVDRNALKAVLASIGVEISSNEARALSRCCADENNDQCFDPSAVASLVRGDTQDRKRGGSADKKRSPKPHGRGIRSSSSSPSDSESSAVLRRRSRGASRQGGSPSSTRSGGSSSSEEGKDGHRPSRRNSRSESRTMGRKSRSRSQLSSSRKKRERGSSAVGTTTSSDSEGGGNTSSEERVDGALVGRRGVSALKKLGGPALDGSMRREFVKLGGGRRHELPTTNLKP